MPVSRGLIADFSNRCVVVSKPVQTGLLRAEIDRLMELGEQKARPPVKEEKIMTSSLIDVKELLARVENDRELMRDLLLLFKEEFPRHHKALRDAADLLDAKRVASEAHTLKGMLSNLAARETAGAAAHLEQLGRNGKTSEFVESLAAFDQLAKELLLQVNSCLVEVPR